MSIKKVFFVHESYVRLVTRYCFVHNYAAVQYSLKLSFSSTLAVVYLYEGCFFFNLRWAIKKRQIDIT